MRGACWQVWRRAHDHLTIAPSQVDIWVSDSELVPSKDNLDCLSGTEIERANRYLLPKKRHQFIAGRVKLRQILSRYLNTPPGSIIFAYTALGKPYIVHDDCPLYFNVSHCSKKIVYAISRMGEVGIDVEAVRDIQAGKLSVRYFDRQEVFELLAMPERFHTSAFLRMWTIKEALAKAEGKSVWSVLGKQTCSVVFFESDFYVKLAPSYAKNWQLLTPDLVNAYVSSVVFSPKIRKVCYMKVHNCSTD